MNRRNHQISTLIIYFRVKFLELCGLSYHKYLVQCIFQMFLNNFIGGTNSIYYILNIERKRGLFLRYWKVSYKINWLEYFGNCGES
jgi:hypothetical protein